MNYNIHARGTPGSIFKMVSALGAMLEGKLYVNETISDERPLHAGDQRRTSPRRLSAGSANPSATSTSSQTIIEGLSHSCNYFFYTLGYRLGETRLYQYASELRPDQQDRRRPARRAAQRRGLSDQPLRPRQGHGRGLDQDTVRADHRLQLHQAATCATRAPAATSPTTTSASTAASSA